MSDLSIVTECSTAVCGAREQRECAVDEGLDIACEALPIETHILYDGHTSKRFHNFQKIQPYK